MVLTVITVYTAKFVNLGHFNIVLALLIASVKADARDLVLHAPEVRHGDQPDRDPELVLVLWRSCSCSRSATSSTRSKVTQTNVRTRGR
jgi:hypothetical protein